MEYTFRMHESASSCEAQSYAHAHTYTYTHTHTHRNHIKIEVKTALPKKWVPKPFFLLFGLDSGTFWELQEGPRAAKSRKNRFLKAMQISREFQAPLKKSLGVTWRALTRGLGAGKTIDSRPGGKKSL